MTVSAHFYGLAMQSLWNAEINYVSGSAKAMLVVNTYTPNQDTHRYLTAVKRSVTDGVLNSTTTVTSATAAFTSADVGSAITGTGIPAGATIASVTNATTVVISAAATATATGVTLTISDEAVGTGYTAGGLALSSKTVTYTAGSNVLALDCADLSWATATVTARYLVVYIDTGSLATSPLIGYVDFGADVTSSGGTFLYTVPTAGLITSTAS